MPLARLPPLGPGPSSLAHPGLMYLYHYPVPEPAQYLNLLQLLQLKDDYENVARIIYELVKRDQREIGFTLAL